MKIIQIKNQSDLGDIIVPIYLKGNLIWIHAAKMVDEESMFMASEFYLYDTLKQRFYHIHENKNYRKYYYPVEFIKTEDQILYFISVQEKETYCLKFFNIKEQHQFDIPLLKEQFINRDYYFNIHNALKGKYLIVYLWNNSDVYELVDSKTNTKQKMNFDIRFNYGINHWNINDDRFIFTDGKIDTDADKRDNYFQYKKIDSTYSYIERLFLSSPLSSTQSTAQQVIESKCIDSCEEGSIEVVNVIDGTIFFVKHYFDGREVLSTYNIRNKENCNHVGQYEEIKIAKLPKGFYYKEYKGHTMKAIQNNLDITLHINFPCILIGVIKNILVLYHNEKVHLYDTDAQKVINEYVGTPYLFEGGETLVIVSQ